MSKYKYVKKFNDELIGLVHPEYDRQLWVKIKMRKICRCQITGKIISNGIFAYRPMTNGYNRMKRISEEGMKLLEASR